MRKKAQITIFILIAVVILIGVSLIIFTNVSDQQGTELKKTTVLSMDAISIKIFVEECVDIVGEKGLIFIGNHGGYYNLPTPSINDQYFSLPYYYFERLDLTPSIETIQNEISFYMNENLLSCLNNFTEFETLGFKIEYGDVNTNTIIGEKSVNIDVNFPTKIQKGEDSISLDDYNRKIDKFPIKKIIEMSKAIIDQQMENPSGICLSCLYDLGESYDLYTNILEYEEDKIIIELASYDTDIVNIYNFTFAIKHSKMNCDNLAEVDDLLFIRSCIENSKQNV